MLAGMRNFFDSGAAAANFKSYKVSNEEARVPIENDEKDVATNSRLDMIVKLLAELNNNDAIVKLDKMQLSRDLIADAVGVTTHNVAQVLYASKKAVERRLKKGDTAKAEVGEAAVAVPSAEVAQ
jgi:hypothetical protein